MIHLLLNWLAFTCWFLASPWLIDFEKAKAEAAQSHKYILINFSGSDWCVPCIRMEKEIFESGDFDNYASEHLVLVRADFPRLKKHQLSKEQTKKNELLAERYNPEGKFPLTVLTDENGKVLKQWEGYPDEPAKEFIKEVNSILNVSR
jgi:thioredoxin-related protein